MTAFNNHLRQIIVLAVIILIGILMLRHFYIFLPGVLGAVTLYILSKQSYFYLIRKKNGGQDGLRSSTFLDLPLLFAYRSILLWY